MESREVDSLAVLAEHINITALVLLNAAHISPRYKHCFPPPEVVLNAIWPNADYGWPTEEPPDHERSSECQEPRFLVTDAEQNPDRETDDAAREHRAYSKNPIEYQQASLGFCVCQACLQRK